METKINIAEILKDKLENTKLYSPLFGDVDFYYVGNDLIKVKHHGGRIVTLFDNGRYYNYPESELLLFPSKEMKDWSKFAWKKGDVLINSCGFQCIFKEWASDDYTKFNGCYSCRRDGYEDVSNAETAKFAKLDHNIAYGYVREIERKLGGKLNLETLEIERQPEFQDGDIAFADYGNRQDVFIVSGITGLSEGYNSFISLDLSSSTLSMGYRTSFFKKDLCKLRLATKEEKQNLFDALAKEGKAWDAEKKQIVDLKPKCEFKPFDRCIWKIRNCEGSIWQASFVSYVDKYGATPMGMSIDEDLVNLIILPYNDQTKLLVGTTDEWKGGEQ